MKRSCERYHSFKKKWFELHILKLSSITTFDGRDAKSFFFILNPCKKYFKDLERLMFIYKEVHPCISWIVIDYDKPYFFSPRHNIRVCPNRSMCNSCNGLVVGTTSLDFKEVLICFPCWQASQRRWGFQEILGSPITKSFLDNFEMCFVLICLSFLCQTHLSSSLETRHATFCLLRSIRSISYRLLCHLAKNKDFSSSILTIHWSLLKDTI